MNALDILQERKWEHPDSYGGFSPVGDYVVLSRTRDSDPLENSNYEVALDSLCGLAEKYPMPKKIDFSDDRNVERWRWDPDKGEDVPIRSERTYGWVYDFRASHWACGWVETILVRDDAPEEILQAAGEIVASLEDYPVLDEEDFSRRESELVQESWECLTLREKVRLCGENGVSIFAARHEECPNDYRIYDYLRTP